MSIGLYCNLALAQSGRPRRSTRDRSELRQSLAPEARIAGIFIKTNTGAIKNTDKSVYL